MTLVDADTGEVPNGSSGDQCPGVTRLAEAHHGKAATEGQASARPASVRRGSPRHLTAARAGHGTSGLAPAALGWASHGSHGTACPLSPRLGRAPHGTPRQRWHLMAGHGGTVHGKHFSRQSRSGRTNHGAPWQGTAGHHTAATERPDEAWLATPRRVIARQQIPQATRPGIAVAPAPGLITSQQPEGYPVTTTASSNGKTAADEAIDAAQPTIKLRRLERVTFEIPVSGTAPLIVNNWDPKSKQMMLEAQQSKARAKKPPKDPVANFEASKYRLPDGSDGFPATAFKAAIVHAARMFEGITQVQLKQTVVVVGEGPEQLVPLTFGGVVMREDTVRNASGVADLRYRAQYYPWSTVLRIRTVAGQFDIDSLFALVDAAGIGGVGEWRPTAPKSATGTFGTFEVVS